MDEANGQYNRLSNKEAVKAAHAKIPIREGRDFVICRVLEWGYQRGGFVDAKQFFAVVIEDDLPELHR
ncbi:hypothetical protein [Bradyrhizobium sp. DASA03007]|uniref:hypothetical protein n=1 Tax=unclassified Bradyrhizobium TaxID=2631580 RepID=UPI003F70FB13